MKYKTVADVVAWRLCIGCGACAAICSERNIEMVDCEDEGMRPRLRKLNCKKCSTCVSICPGIQLRHRPKTWPKAIDASLQKGWGPILKMWEGYATDDAIRFAGSSGGVASALALFCIEKKGMAGVVHNGMDKEKPWKNRTFFSTNYQEILTHCGSRYCPASVCEGLNSITGCHSPCVFIGKPCDVAAVRNIENSQTILDGAMGLVIGIFCAGTPATKGLTDYLGQNHIALQDVASIRFRGNGWPGNFTVQLKNEKKSGFSTGYGDSWGFLQKYRPYRCYLCPDGTSEFADISVGDPWYREIHQDEKGSSLVIGRTQRGLEIVQQACDAGYVTLHDVPDSALPRSQINLFEKRSSIWARLSVARLLCIPSPFFSGFHLFKLWNNIPLKEKAYTVAATLKRLILRRYWKPNKPIV